MQKQALPASYPALWGGDGGGGCAVVPIHCYLMTEYMNGTAPHGERPGRQMRQTERRWRVLLVEDSPQDVFFFEHAIKKVSLHAELKVCRDGDETQQYLSEILETGLLPDLVLLDLNLPRVSGREVLAWIREQAALRTVPVLVLTTSDDPNDVQEVYRLGGNCFIPKPAGMRDFIHVLRGIQQFWFGLARIPTT